MNLGLGLGLTKQTGGASYLDSAISSVVFELEATDAASYPGSGNDWLNLTKVPADGETQATYDFNNTNAGDLFSGTAGDAAAKFVMAGDATNIFDIDANTDFVNSLHKTTGGSDFTMIIAGKVSDIDASGKVMLGTQTNSGSIGLSGNWSADDTFRLQQYGGSGEVQKDSAQSYADGKTFLAFIAHDAANDVTRITINGVITEVAHVFDTTTSDATDEMHIGGHPGAAYLPSGFELYTVALCNSYLTRAEEEAVRSLLETRHGRDYSDDGSVVAFSFSDTSDADLSTLYTSDIVEIQGFSGSKAISISGGSSPQYRVYSDAAGTDPLTDWTSDAGTIEGERYVAVRDTSSDENSTALNVTLDIGGTTDIWTLTTAAGVSAPLGDIVASTVLDLDATIAASYSGSGTTWANYEDTPADSAAQTAYDFTNNGFTFTGSAGSAAAYWLADGTNQFDLGGGNTAFLSNLPKTTGGGDWWAAFTFNLGSAVTQRIFHTGPDNTNPLMGAFINGSDALNIFQRGDASSSNQNVGGSVGTATNHIIIISHDVSADKTSYWINSGTGTEISHVFQVCSNPAGAFTIGAQSDGDNPLTSGTKLYSFAMGNEYLNDTKAAAIISHLETRHARDYTP